MKKDEPRKYVKGLGWPVDLAVDTQTNCNSCDAPCYWIKIENRHGRVVPMLMSEATAKRDPALTSPPTKTETVYMSAHFSDCPYASEHRRTT